MNKLLLIILTLFTSFGYAQTDKQLVDRYDKMYAAEKFELALSAATMICDRYPSTATWHFNAGALLARLDQPEQAIEYLTVAAENGYTGVRSFEQNSDLDPVRELEEFQTILDTVRSNANARLEEFQGLAKQHQPEKFIPQGIEGITPPIVIALHGTGMRGADMLNAIQPACEKMGAILIAPDGIRKAGDGFSWTYRDEAEWYVDYLIEQAANEHDGDPDRVVLIGFSQGANIALILGQTQPKKFLAVVPICGHYESQNAATSEGTQPSPFYLMIGSRDPWKKTYPIARRDFEAAGGSVQTRILSGKGHELPVGKSGEREYTRALIWAFEQQP